MRPDENFRALLRQNAEGSFGKNNVFEGVHAAGSTDMGDLSHLIPVVHPWVGCVTGVLHGASYNLTDPKTALNKSAKVLAMTIIDLLADDAAQADFICKNHKPVMTKQSYCEFMDAISEGR